MIKQITSTLKWRNPFRVLREKWYEVPTCMTRISTKDLLNYSDEDLLNHWTQVRLDETTGENFGLRGWYHQLYKDYFSGKKILDVGSGFGVDGITFAQNSANVTFVDIIETNLELLKRICSILKLKNVDFFYLESINAIEQLPINYDVIWCMGSLIHAPFDFIQQESHELLKHLKIGGRWIELGYPEQRWIREGKMPFEKWGEKTDGGAPWVEWYDLEKIKLRFSPSQFDVVLSFNFHHDDFNWFDLIKK